MRKEIRTEFSLRSTRRRRYATMTSISGRYLEFAGVSLDLRQVNFSTTPDANKNYILFLNVKRAMYRNFSVWSDLSLESLALFVYENVKYTDDRGAKTIKKNLAPVSANIINATAAAAAAASSIINDDSDNNAGGQITNGPKIGLPQHDVDYDKFEFNENDRNQSIVINLSKDARIIVAATIRLNEKYYQRVSGYMDFEKRHERDYQPPTPAERAKIDRDCEIYLLEFT